MNRLIAASIIALSFVSVPAFASDPAQGNGTECTGYAQAMDVMHKHGVQLVDGDGQYFLVYHTEDPTVDIAIVFDKGCAVDGIKVPAGAIEGWLKTNPHGSPGTNPYKAD